MNFVEIQNAQQLPEYGCVLNRLNSPLITLPGDAGHYMALASTLEGCSHWEAVLSGQRQARVYIAATVKMLDKNTHLLLDALERVRKIQGLVVDNTIYILPAVEIEYLLKSTSRRIDQKNTSDQTSAERLFDELAVQAAEMGASDIHIALRNGERAWVRLRRNGALEFFRNLDYERAYELVRAMYTAMGESGSRSDAYNILKTQDTVINRVFNTPKVSGTIRFRFNSMPTSNGADVTLRLLRVGVENEKVKTFEELGYHPTHIHAIRRAFSKPSGMVIIAGTTGSGKSTTLKTAIEWVGRTRPDIMIRTIEEPVEYRIACASQHPVARDPGETGTGPFAAMIRAAMRADPDFIMIGEVRDDVTAKLAIEAALTGHQVATTIHANGWLAIMERLAMMGIDRRLVAQPGMISALIYQKLVPVLCDHCKIPHETFVAGLDLNNPEDAERIEMAERYYRIRHPKDTIFHRNPKGCPHCRAGIKGREVCAEIEVPDRRMLTYLSEGDMLAAERYRLEQRVAGDDMTGRTAMDHAILKMRRGYVAPEDVEHAFGYFDEWLDLNPDFGTEDYPELV